MVRKEVCKTGFTGVRDGLVVHGIGLPPIIHHASSRLKSHGAPKLLSGVKIICLAISEPNAGLDVSNITIKAVRDGADFIVNGEKT
ncbi:MAG: acyl-CoA dehydrogenase, partial [Rhodospirillaceae bacterium]|nr:acyl-CoA dehydrogenase [Rhodospirillaceae bacterium]